MSDCAVCLDLLQARDATRLECGHAFHSACIDRWVSLKPSCPVCRAPSDTLTVRRALELAAAPHLFGCMQRYAFPEKLFTLFPESRGSLYVTAVGYARKAVHLSVQGYRMDEYKVSLAYMLAYLHFSGDFRAARAAREPSTNEAEHIAQGLAQWAARATSAQLI